MPPPGTSQTFEPLLDLLVGQPVVGQRVAVLRCARALLALGVRLLDRGTRLDAEVPVDAVDAGNGILDEVEIVDVTELRGIMLCANSIEPLEPTRPRLHRVLADLSACERVRPAGGGVVCKRAHRRHDGLRGPM